MNSSFATHAQDTVFLPKAPSDMGYLFEGCPFEELRLLTVKPSDWTPVEVTLGALSQRELLNGTGHAVGHYQRRLVETPEGIFLEFAMESPELLAEGSANCDFVKERLRLFCFKTMTSRIKADLDSIREPSLWCLPVIRFEGAWPDSLKKLQRLLGERLVRWWFNR